MSLLKYIIYKYKVTMKIRKNVKQRLIKFTILNFTIFKNDNPKTMQSVYLLFYFPIIILFGSTRSLPNRKITLLGPAVVPSVPVRLG